MGTRSAHVASVPAARCPRTHVCSQPPHVILTFAARICTGTAGKRGKGKGVGGLPIGAVSIHCLLARRLSACPALPPVVPYTHTHLTCCYYVAGGGAGGQEAAGGPFRAAHSLPRARMALPSATAISTGQSRWLQHAARCVSSAACRRLHDVCMFSAARFPLHVFRCTLSAPICTGSTSSLWFSFTLGARKIALFGRR
jgi:hypothetical protein